MSERVMASARIATEIVALHECNVQEKHATDSLYKGIEAEMAIREFLDEDDFAAIEERLRDRCTSVGCSTAKIKSSVAGVSSEEKKMVQWRIRSELKEELKAYAEAHDKTYSSVFGLAIREYWENSRADRIEQLVDRLETAIGPWEDQIGSDGVNVSVQDRRTAEIAMELGDDVAFSRPELEAAIAEVTSDSSYNIKTYTPKVAEYKDVEEHPRTSAVFVPHEEAEEIRAEMDESESEDLFERSYDGLDAEECERRVCVQLVRKAARRGGTAAMGHSDVWNEFDEEPSRTTIYNIMDRVDDYEGFEEKTVRGTKRLEVRAKNVSDPGVLEIATETDETCEADESDARSRLDELDQAEAVR